MRVMTTEPGTPSAGAEEAPPRPERGEVAEDPREGRADDGDGPSRDRDGGGADPTGRSCARPGCPGTARATLRFGYGTREVVLGRLAVAATPHSYDLCSVHAERTSPPRGWSLTDRRGTVTASPTPPQPTSEAAGSAPAGHGARPGDGGGQPDPPDAAPHDAAPDRDFRRSEIVAVLAAALEGSPGRAPRTVDGPPEAASDGTVGAPRLRGLSPGRPPRPVLAQRGVVTAPDVVGVGAGAPPSRRPEPDAAGSDGMRARDW